jgi:integrase
LIDRLPDSGLEKPSGISPSHIRTYPAGLASRNLAGSTIHCHPPDIKAFLPFCNSEEYINEHLRFEMPIAGQPDLSILTAKQLQKAITAGDELKDQALVLLLAESGLPRGEIVALTWGDRTFKPGLESTLQFGQ